MNTEIRVEQVPPGEIDRSTISPVNPDPPKHFEAKVRPASDESPIEHFAKVSIFRIQLPGGTQLPDGRWQKLMVRTSRLTIYHSDLAAYTRVAMHHHLEEQFGYICDGALELNIDGEKHLLYEGDSYFIPSQIPHALTAIYDAKVLRALIVPG